MQTESTISLLLQSPTCSTLTQITY